MIKQGNPLSLDEVIANYQNDDVFNGKYYEKMLDKSDPSVKAKYKSVQQDIVDNSLIKELGEINRTLTQMGLAAQMLPQMNGEGKITGYKMTVYSPNNKDQVFEKGGKVKDKKGAFSWSQSIDVAFDDTVNLGHSGINDYVDMLDRSKDQIVRVKRNEAGLKIFNEKLQSMSKAVTKNKNINKIGAVKSAFRFSQDELKAVSLQSSQNLNDKEKDNYKTGSQAVNAMLSERVNLSPLLTAMKYSYGVDERYNKKIIEILSLVSHAKDEAEALEIINAREKDLRSGVKNIEGVKKTLLSARLKNLEYDVGNTSETSYTTYKSSTYNRNVMAGDVLLSATQREQGRKNAHRLGVGGENKELQKKMFSRGVLASRTGEAKNVKYAGDIVDENGDLAYDAVVKAVEMTDEELAKQNQKNLSVREGQSVISKAFADVIDTSHHTMKRTYNDNDFKEEAEYIAKEIKELNARKKSKDLTEGDKGLIKKRLAELTPLIDENGNITDKAATAKMMFRKFLDKQGMELLKKEDDSSADSGLELFEDKDNGSLTLSGEGRVRFKNGRRGTDTVGNIRSEMIKGVYKDENGNDRNAFDEIQMSDASGDNMGSLSSHNVQVIVGRDQLDARKYGQRMKTDIVSTLIDARELGKLDQFMDELVQDAADKTLPEETRKYAQFYNEILEKGQGGKVYISDDSEKVKSLLQKNDAGDETAKKYLSGLLDYLDTKRAALGGNEGAGKVYSLDDSGNLSRTSATRTLYTNLGGDDNVQYGKRSDVGAVNFRTGYDSMTRALNMAVTDIIKKDGKTNGNVFRTAEDIAKQFDAPQKNKEELVRLQKSNDDSMKLMKETLSKGIDVKNLDAGKERKQKQYITVGKGEGYDINVDNLQTETYENGEVINKDKTLTYAIDEVRKELGNLQVVIDTQGTTFGKIVSYGDKSYGYGGKAIFLDKDNGGLEGYSERGYGDVLNNVLLSSLQGGEAKRIEAAADLAVETMHDSVYFKEGSDFDRLMNGKMSQSMSGKTSAVNMANIMTREEYEEEKRKQDKNRESGNADYTKLLKSDIASYGIEVSAKTVEGFLNGWKADGSNEKLYNNKELLKMLKGFGIKEDREKGRYETKDGNLDRDKIIKAIVETLTVDSSRWKEAYKNGNLTEGLQAVAGRFPFMNGLDLDTVAKVFVGKNLEGEQVRVGAGLAKKENADYDGDHENLGFMKFNSAQKGLFNRSAGLRADVLQKLAWIAKEEGQKDDADGQVFSDDFYKGVSNVLIEQSAALASRRNKGATGVFSNFASQIRNTMRDRGFDETAMKHGTQEEMENGAASIIVRSYFEAMEQDMISAKKVIKRLAAKTNKAASEITEKEAKEYQRKILEEVDNLMQDFYDGKITFLDLNKLLGEMGIMSVDGEGKNATSKLQNRVTEAGLLSIEGMDGGKEYLQKLYGGHYLEYATYGHASKGDIDFAKSFEGKGGFGAWDKTKQANDYYKKLDAAGAKYNKEDIYSMLVSGKTGLSDFGTIGQKVFEQAMTQASEFLKEHGEAGIDGTPDSLIRTAHFKTHSPDKKSVAVNPYHAGEVTQQEAHAIENGTAQNDGDGKSEKLILGNASAISTLAQDLAEASGDVSKTLSVIFNALMGFVDQAKTVASGMTTPRQAALAMKDMKWFKEPFSTTSITRMFSPYEGIGSDPQAVDKVLANRGRKFLGFGSLSAMKDALGNGKAASASLLGHVVGERTQFTQSLRNVANAKGWKGSEKDLIRIFKANLEDLRKDVDDTVSQELVKFYDEYSKDETKYFEYLKALHGKNGYNDKDFFLKKQGYSSFKQMMEEIYKSQSKVMQTFFAPENLVAVNGKKTATNETAFIGMADTSGETNYIGRTDISGLRREKYVNQDGTATYKNVLSLVDQKTKTGQSLTAGDLLQGMMNAQAARQDIEFAKLFAGEGGGGYDEWIKTAAAKKLKERTEAAGFTFDGKQRYDELVAADTAQSYIEKTNPNTKETHLVALESLFTTPMLKVIMGEVAQVMKGNVPQDHAIKMINSMGTQLVDAGVNFKPEADTEHPYANYDSPDAVSKAYLGFARKKIDLNAEKDKLEYQLDTDGGELSEAEKKLIKNNIDKITNDIKEVDEAIVKALETGASSESFTDLIDGKSVMVDINKELEKSKEAAQLKFDKFKEDKQGRAADLYSKLMQKKAEQEDALKRYNTQLTFRYGVDTPEKYAEIEAKRNEAKRNLAITDNDIEKGNFQKRLKEEDYEKVKAEYQNYVQDSEKNISGGLQQSAIEEAEQRYNKLLKERVALQEKEKEILYDIAHLKKNATEDEKKAYEAQLLQNRERQKQLRDQINEEEKIPGLDRSKSEEFEAAERATSKKAYKDYESKRQKEARADLASQLGNLIKIRQRQNERNIRSGGFGVNKLSNEQKLLNEQLNEQDEAEYQKGLSELAGRDWESDVGGAEAYAEVLQEAALSAKTADRSLAALNADLNPTIWDSMKNSVKGWFNQMLRGQIVWKVLGAVQSALKGVIEDAKKLDSVLVDLQIVTGDTRNNTKSLISTYSSLAQQLSVTTSEVASAANDWLRQGYSVSETTDLITASMQLSKLGMIESGQATSYLTSMLKGFKLEASDATSVVDKLTKVDMSAATSAGDIAESLRQFATTAQLSGLDLDESIAMATTIMDVSQKDASSTGNAIKTMLSRYGNVKAGTYSGMNITGDQNETTESLNDIEKVLRKLGISLRSSNLEFREFDDVLDDIAAKWDTLDSVSKNAIATAMAGTRQRESFLVLMENYDKYKDFIAEAANAEGTAAEKYKAYEDSLEASQKKLAAAWEELASKTEVVDFLKNVNNAMAQLVKALPFISRVFIRMFAGKAATNAIKILGRSFPKNINPDSIKESLKHPVRSIKDNLDVFSNPLLKEGRFSASAKATGRSGLIDSQIRKGTSPLLEELKKIVANTSKSGEGDQSLGGMPGAGKKDVSLKEKDPSKMTNDEILKSKNIAYKDKKKLLNNKMFNDEIAANKEKQNKLKEKAKNSENSLKDIYSGEEKQLKERNKELKKQQKEFNKNFEENEYVATHAEEATLEDGTKFSDIHENKNGTYSAKGRKGFISKDEYNKAKAQQEANNQAASKQFKAKKNAAKGQAAIQGAVAGITGFMSAETNNKHYNQFTGEWVERETTNENAKGIMKANTGIASALGTYFGGELGGQLAGAAADMLNKYVIGNIIPSVRDENKKQDRFDQIDKKKSQVESVKTSISNVVDLASKDLLTADDYSNLVQAQDSMRDELTKSDNAALKDEFVAYANKFLAGQSEGNEYAAKSFDELTNLADMTDAQRKKTAYALKVAQTKQENLAENAEYEKELDALNTDLDSDYLDVSGYNDAAKANTIALTGAGAATGAMIGASAGAGLWSWATGAFGAVVGGLAGYGTAKAENEALRASMLDAWNDKSRDEQIAELEQMQKTGQGNSAKLQEMISKLNNINDTIKKIRDKMDQQRVEEGILEMSVGKNADGTDKTLLDMSSNAIKDMGTDEIVERMATYLQDKYGGMADGSSYFYEDENGNKQVTASARASILKGLKSNTDIYGAITGQNSRLSDVLGMKDGQSKTEMLENFANALHVSVDELNSLGDAFGQFTLGDLTASAEELSEKFSNLESTISNIASGTQSWSTTLQNVTKNYPELIGYASDEYSLSLAMFQKMKDYQSLQTDAQMSDIMSNETYFDTFSDKLKETLSGDEWEEFRQAQINSFNDLQQYVANTDSDFAKKLNEAAQEELSNIKLASDTERQTLEKVISIKSAQIDKEVNNLTAQKTAMQNINSQREYENKLIEAKLRLENASKEKKRVWREGVGWVYEEDQAAISDAKKNLDSVTNEKATSALDQQIAQLNTDKENLSAILSDQEEAIQAAFLQAYEDANGVTNESIDSLGSSITSALDASKTSADEKWKEWMDTYKKKENTAKDTLATQYKALQAAKEAMGKEGLTDEERAKAQENYNNALAAYQSTYNSGVSNGYWKSSDFEENGEMYKKLGGAEGKASEATIAGAGGAGYKKEEPDQFLYRKTEEGKWQKFVFNPGKTDLVSSSEWNKFYDKDGQTGVDLYNTQFKEKDSDHKLYINKDTGDRVGASIYQAAQDNPSANSFATWLNENYTGATLGKIVKDNMWVRFVGGMAYRLKDPVTVSAKDVPEEVKAKGGQFKQGSIDISMGNRIPLLMNEEGTEAIVTPQGTITALPSHSGILPEDITTNLWSLGNLAPDLLMALQRQSLIDMGTLGSVADNSIDNSVNINTVQMTVDADNGFNVDSFVRQLQQVAALTRNNKH